jgi:hypothetical protein
MIANYTTDLLTSVLCRGRTMHYNPSYATEAAFPDDNRFQLCRRDFTSFRPGFCIVGGCKLKTLSFGDFD